MARKLILFACLFSNLLFARSYSTSFVGTENPISESGNWVNGGTVGIDWTNVRKTPGFAFGTQPGTDPCSAGNGCTDSTAIISGPWGADQTVQATALVPNASTSTSVNEEIELRLRTNITAHSITGYEIICSVIANSTSGNYIQIIKWLGPLGSFTSLNGFTGHCVTGDVFKATVTGTASTVITVFKNGVTIGSATDSSSPWTSGAPGVGFFLIGTTGVNANYGFSDFTATDGIATQLWSSIMADTRGVDWTQAGVVGGIPSATWTQCGSTISAGATIATINAAIVACGSNQYVQLGSGTFNLTTGLLWNSKSNVALRGLGADQTLLVFSGSQGCSGSPNASVCFMSSDINYFGSPSNLANWTAGYVRGATTLTLSSVTNLKVGNPITLDQTDDVCGTITGGVCAGDNSAIFVCFSPINQCSTNGDNGGAPRAGRSQQQIVNVASCDGNSTAGHACVSGANITISPGLAMSNWSSGKTPQAWWATNPVQNVGIENVSIDSTGNGGHEAITFFNCQNCWAKGVRSIGPTQRSHVIAWQSAHITVQDSYFYKTNDSASVNYGIESFPASYMLVQNDVFEQIQAPYPANGTCTGCVFAYNFDVNNVFVSLVFQNQSGFAHAVGDDNILYEGNIGSGFASDNFHGTHHLITNFRNYWNGYQLNEGSLPNQATTPLIFLAYSRFYNAIGNVLGNPARHATYASLFNIGTGNAIPNDPQTGITLMRWGNYANCSGTSPCGTNNFDTTEVPSGLTGNQSAFATLVPVQALPPSFYLAAQPSWWPITKTWPPIGPDVAGGNVKYCVGGSQSGAYVLTSAQCPGGTATTLAGGRIVSNPAMDCYLNTMSGTPDGTGSVLSFNANACYAAALNSPSANLQGSIKAAGAVVLK